MTIWLDYGTNEIGKNLCRKFIWEVAFGEQDSTNQVAFENTQTKSKVDVLSKWLYPLIRKDSLILSFFGFQVWSLILHLKSLDLFGSSTAIYRPLCPWLCFLRILKRYERWSDFGTMYVRKCYNNKCERKWIKRRMEIESSWKYNVRWMLARRPEMFRDVIILW